MVPVSSPGTWSDNDRDQTDAVPRGMCRGGVGWMGKWEMSEDDVCQEVLNRKIRRRETRPQQEYSHKGFTQVLMELRVPTAVNMSP
ncbi:hypothetical protein O5D80_001581 [Batrachochytrium dendrobatidis]|nr:hypothetical protein O5D80_001581 [Batrachochytrium dendrobatidis]